MPQHVSRRHRSTGTRLLQANRTSGKCHHGPATGPWKIWREHSRRWVLLPTGWHQWTIKCLSTASFNNGYLTFWLLNCRKSILTQVLLHFNLSSTGKHQWGHDRLGTGLAPGNVGPTGVLTVFSASLTPAISDPCGRAGFVYSSGYRRKECFGFILYIHIYSFFWADSSFLR